MASQLESKGNMRSRRVLSVVLRIPKCTSHLGFGLVLQSHIHSHSNFGLSISLVSFIADARTEAKFDGLQVPSAQKFGHLLLQYQQRVGQFLFRNGTSISENSRIL